MIKIVAVDAYPYDQGGAHVVLRDLAVAGAAGGAWHLTVLFPDDGPAPAWLANEGVEVRVVPAGDALLHFAGAGFRAIARRPWALLGYWLKVFGHLARADVVHLNDQRGAVLALVPALLSGRRRVLHLHNPADRTRAQRCMLLLLCLACTKIVTPSRRALPPAIASLAKVCEVPNGVALPAMVAKRSTGRVLCVARLHPDKGLDLLLDAWNLCSQAVAGASLTVVGGAARGHEAFAAELLGRADKTTVTFVGRVLDPSQYYLDASVYAQPSLDEPFGLAALEAQAAGLPVVAFAAGGLVDVVADGVSGFLVPTGDVAALAAALELLLIDAGLADRMAKAARVHAGTFGTVIFGRRMAEVYASVVAQ